MAGPAPNTHQLASFIVYVRAALSLSSDKTLLALSTPAKFSSFKRVLVGPAEEAGFKAALQAAIPPLEDNVRWKLITDNAAVLSRLPKAALRALEEALDAMKTEEAARAAMTRDTSMGILVSIFRARRSAADPTAAGGDCDAYGPLC